MATAFENTDSNKLNPDYNYRSLNKIDSMSLSRVNENDASMKKFKQLDTKRDWSLNMYNLDIPGSVPKRYGVFHHKENYINKVDDIERANPRLLHIGLNKAEYNLTNKDIEGSYPQCVKFKTTRQPCNPLEPKYQVCKVEQIETPTPKFIRDNIHVTDIDGAKPRKYFRWDTRTMFRNDIDGSSPKKKYCRNSNYNYYDYSDVTKDKFETKRCVNPLEPVYELNYKGGEHYSYGHIEGSKPVTYPPYIYPEPYNLRTEDIEGCKVGTKYRINKFTGLNYNLTSQDIKGTRAGSLKKGIATERMTNPVDPIYKLPGEKELTYNNNPYGNTLVSKSAKVRSESSALKKVNQGINSEKNGKQVENNLEKKTNDDILLGTQDKNLNPNDIFGFNNQAYLEDPINFDPESYKKPLPFYGFVHDKFLISSNNPLANTNLHENKKLIKNDVRSTINFNGIPPLTTSNGLSSEGSKNNLSKPKSIGLAKEGYKRSYAQLLDNFIG